MYDELTQVDIDKMKEEIRYRMTELRPKLIEDVQNMEDGALSRVLGNLWSN